MHLIGLPDAQDTVIDAGGYGSVIHVKSSNVAIENFTIQNADIEPKYAGIQIFNEVSNINITDNTIQSNGAGISTAFCSPSCKTYIKISHNNIHNNAFYGIRLKTSNNMLYKNNVGEDNSSVGIKLDNASYNNTITGNTIRNNTEDGIFLNRSDNNNISSNQIKNNGRAGIRFDAKHLRFLDPDPDFCEDNIVYNNTIENNRDGIYMFMSQNNNFTENNIRNNDHIGFNIVYYNKNRPLQRKRSRNNNIYHNNFEQNGKNAKDRGLSASRNHWDNGAPKNKPSAEDPSPYGGNYWDDYEKKNWWRRCNCNKTKYGTWNLAYPVSALVYDNHPWYYPNGWRRPPSPNLPPETPSKPTGPSEGKGEVGEEIWFSTSTSDPDGDEIYYKFNWGDGNISGWFGPFDSEEKANMTHVWHQSNTYLVKAKAMDTNDAKSEWSKTCKVHIQ